MASLNRWLKAEMQKPTRYGQLYDPATERIANMTGVRMMHVGKDDIKQSLRFSAMRFEDRIRDANRILLTAKHQKIPQVELDRARAFAEERRQELFAEAHQQTKDALLLGLTTQQIVQTFDDVGWTANTISAVLSGEYLPYVPEDERVRGGPPRLPRQPRQPRLPR